MPLRPAKLTGQVENQNIAWHLPRQLIHLRLQGSWNDPAKILGSFLKLQRSLLHIKESQKTTGEENSLPWGRAACPILVWWSTTCRRQLPAASHREPAKLSAPRKEKWPWSRPLYPMTLHLSSKLERCTAKPIAGKGINANQENQCRRQCCPVVSSLLPWWIQSVTKLTKIQIF